MLRESSMTARSRRPAAGVLLAIALTVGGVACTNSSDDSGAVTNLDDVGPQIAKLRAEVAALRAEVRSLREAVATGSATTTTVPLR